MGIKCPECDFANPEDLSFCGKCGTQLIPSDDVSPSITKTIETPIRRLEIGSIFAGRYEILEELGKGGMGEVYRVKDEKLDEEMSLKVLKPEIAAYKETIERFKNELKFARKIAHRNVCRMYDLNEEEETPYITMEYVKGEDLKSFIRKKERLREEEVIAVAKQVCEGLAEAHKLGVVHRDLKPQNIMIDEKGNAKVMDFGIARSVEAPGVTITGVMIGTPDYMSPEQAEGEEADQRSDIYALGVILYEMVTGNVPFTGDTALSVALKHKTQLPQDPKKLNPEVSEDLSRLILVCIEKERERRYQTASELLDDLRNIEEGFPLGTKIRPRRETFFAALIRKKLVIPALVAVLLVVAVVLIWQLLPQKKGVPLVPSGKPSLAIMYFENNTGDENLDHWRKMLSDLLFTDLFQSKYLDLLPGDRLFKILSQLNQLGAKTYSADVLHAVADQGKVSHLVLGSYARIGDVFRIDARIQDPKTGEVIGAKRLEVRGEEEVFNQVDDLTRSIKEIFNFSADDIADDIDKEVGKITTSSLEAYKNYSEAKKYELTGDWQKSNQFYKKAIAIDPEFAQAYIAIGTNYARLGYTSEHRKYIKKAFEFRERLSDRERYLAEGAFYRPQTTRDKAIEAYNKLLELYPEDREVNRALAAFYLLEEQWEKVIELLEVNIQNKSEHYLAYLYPAVSYRAKGLYDKASEVLESYLNNISDNAKIHWNLAHNYLCQGKYDLAHVEADKMLSLDPTSYFYPWLKGDIYHSMGDFVEAEMEYQKLLEDKDPIAHIVARFDLGALNLLKGNFEKSQNQFRQGVELAKKIGDKWWELRQHFRLAYTHLRSENTEQALIECNKIWNIAGEEGRLSFQQFALYLKGLTYLEMKSIDEARKTANELKQLIDKGMNRNHMRYYFHLVGMIEFEEENCSEAIVYFKKAISLLSHQKHFYHYFLEDHPYFYDSLASAYYKTGDVEKARQEYERITSLTSARLWYGDIVSKSFYILGKIYEEKGWEGKAIESYEKFLNLWKDADPGIAEVEDAKKRLAGLKNH